MDIYPSWSLRVACATPVGRVGREGGRHIWWEHVELTLNKIAYVTATTVT